MGYGDSRSLDVLEEVLTAPQLRAAYGVGVHGATARWLFRAITRYNAMPLERQQGVGLVGSGVGLWYEAYKHVRPHARAHFIFEPEPHAAEGCQALLEELEGRQVPQFGWAHDYDSISSAALIGAGVLLISIACAPYSRANTNFPSDVDRGLAELAGVARLIAAVQPWLVFVEQTSALMEPSRADARAAYEAILTNNLEYTWAYVIVCPRLHLGEATSRLRVIYVGVRRELIHLRCA